MLILLPESLRDLFIQRENPIDSQVSDLCKVDPFFPENGERHTAPLFEIRDIPPVANCLHPQVLHDDKLFRMIEFFKDGLGIMSAWQDRENCPRLSEDLGNLHLERSAGRKCFLHSLPYLRSTLYELFRLCHGDPSIPNHSCRLEPGRFYQPEDERTVPGNAAIADNNHAAILGMVGCCDGKPMWLGHCKSAATPANADAMAQNDIPQSAKNVLT